MKTNSLKTLAATVLVASFGASSAFAAPASLLRYDSDTRTNSASTQDVFSNVAGGDTDGSLKFSTGAGPGGNKVAVTFYTPGGTGTPAGGVLGTLGDLASLTFDYYVTGPATERPAVRLKMSPNGTPSSSYVDLVWEPAYNGGSAANVWHNDVSILGGSFWQRSNNVNHDGAPDFRPLADFVAGYTPTFGGPGVALSAASPIYGVEFAMGSGLPNNFSAYIDDVQIGFTGTDGYAANIVAPEPTSLAAIAGAAAVGLRRRRAAR